MLERLAESGYITRECVLVDYGCGKGRTDFYFSHRIGCKSIGIEYDERIYKAAIKNLETYRGTLKPEFTCTSAEHYVVTDGDCFYFFNPFTAQLLEAV